MGADIIIGVDVQNALKSADKLNSAPDILGQIVDLTCQTNHEKNVELTDTYIKVNVDGFSSASFTPAAIDSLMRRGEEAARAPDCLKKRNRYTGQLCPQTTWTVLFSFQFTDSIRHRYILLRRRG